ncbi:unnamed protein product [Effrenium voratum]|nr:unnamed protein product [Effrenium voratum]
MYVVRWQTYGSRYCRQTRPPLMGCGASAPVSVYDTHPETVVVDRYGNEEESIDFVQPQRSFQSMTCRAPTTKMSPTVSAHRRHLGRLKNYLKRVSNDQTSLREDVQLRRLELCVG